MQREPELGNPVSTPILRLTSFTRTITAKTAMHKVRQLMRADSPNFAVGR